VKTATIIILLGCLFIVDVMALPPLPELLLAAMIGFTASQVLNLNPYQHSDRRDQAWQRTRK
jgi:hypothetical protein